MCGWPVVSIGAGLMRTRSNCRAAGRNSLPELREMITTAGIEGASFEYWSPAPYWKANRSFAGWQGKGTENVLRCFGKDFRNDPD